jgi:TLC domain
MASDGQQRPFANYYGINFVLYELSTPFLNIHWFMDKLDMTGSRAQLVNGILLLATFAGCRLVWGVYQSALIYNDVWQAWHATTPFANRCSAFFRTTGLGALVNVPLACRVLPTWLGVVYVGANTVLTLLNFYWYAKMVAAVRKRFEPRRKVGGTVGEKKEK